MEALHALTKSTGEEPELVHVHSEHRSGVQEPRSVCWPRSRAQTAWATWRRSWMPWTAPWWLAGTWARSCPSRRRAPLPPLPSAVFKEAASTRILAP